MINRTAFSKRSWSKAVSAFLPSSYALMVAIYIAFSWYPVSQTKLEKIRPDMTKDDVSQFVGRPTTVLDQPHWQYRRMYCLMTIEVDFDTDDHFVQSHWE